MKNPDKPKMKVTDRRHFTSQGERRGSDAPQEENGWQKDAAGGTPSGTPAQGPQARASIEFETLVLSLTRQALMLMGEEPDPQGKQVEPQMEAARGLVDMLMALREKTKGNLTPDEEELVRRVIYELQMKFAQKMKS